MDNYKRIFWISSYPKSGNTWLRLILCGLFYTNDGIIDDFKILNNIPKFDLLNNFKFIKKISIDDYNLIFKNNYYDEKTLVTYSKYWIEAQKKIKHNKKFIFYKTHNARVKLNATQIPYTNEITTLGFIYVSRDPRDIVLSYSKHTNKNIDEVIKLLNEDKIMGKIKSNNRMLEVILSWKDHYCSWKNFTSVPSLFLRYEDLINNFEDEINKILLFFYNNFNIKIENQNQKIKNIIKSTNFKNLKNIEDKKGFVEKSEFSNFFRVGKNKQWEKKLNTKQKKLIENYFKDQMNELNYY